ncbi:MAG: metal ABC transporter permease [Magnetococcales bacterium]|nr:metal ABC transporter permease [Magnetococcales bacterium]
MGDLLLLPWLAGVGVALVGGPLGCFIVWRRMAYFGDTMAHSALLGVTLGVLLELNPTLGVLLVCTTLALILLLLTRCPWLSSDTLLGILSHGALSLGLVALAFVTGLRVDLMGYLFGDVLAVDGMDLAWIFGGGALVLGVLGLIWRPLLALTVHEDLARAEGVRVGAVKLVFMLLIALVIAMAMKIVGILLITSLLIIPAAAARPLAAAPERMALLAIAMGILAVSGGLLASAVWDIPSGPAMVMAAMGLFMAGLARSRRKGY